MTIPDGLLEYTQDYVAGDGQGQSIPSSVLSGLVLGVLDLFETETGVKFTKSADPVTKIISTLGGTRVAVPSLFTVTKVEWSYWPVGDNWSEIPTDTWVQSGRTVLRNVRLNPGYIRLTGTEGVDSADDLPPSIKSHVAEVVGILYRSRKSVRPTFDSQEPGADRNLIPPHVWRILRAYRQAATA